jgi:hypothetical protein
MVGIHLTHGKVALVDNEDAPSLLQYRWYAMQSKPTGRWYAVAYIDGKLTLMQRVISPAADGHNVKFINGDSLDLRRENLRPTRRRSRRTTFSRSGPTTGRRGVSYHRGTQKYIARVYENGEQIWLGSFPTEQEAAQAHQEYVNPTIPQDQVAERAYQLYVERAYSDGNPNADWIAAEEQLRQERRRELVKSL